MTEEQKVKQLIKDVKKEYKDNKEAQSIIDKMVETPEIVDSLDGMYDALTHNPATWVSDGSQVDPDEYVKGVVALVVDDYMDYEDKDQFDSDKDLLMFLVDGTLESDEREFLKFEYEEWQKVNDMVFGFMLATADVEISDDGRSTIILHDEDNQQLSDLVRYQCDDLEDSMFDTPREFMKVTDEQINQLFQDR